MKLKKIHTELQRRLVELGFEQPSDLLKDSFGTVKSGRDAVIISEHSYPELEDIAIHAIQKADKAIMFDYCKG